MLAAGRKSVGTASKAKPFQAERDPHAGVAELRQEP